MGKKYSILCQRKRNNTDLKKHTFILSDQTINAFNFVVLTSGIKLDFFKKNPVMLYDHDKSKILGRWENIRVEGTQLLADAIFDEKDPEALKMYEKVEQGMLNCVSIGFEPIEVVMGIEGFENNPVVIESSIKEASLTPLPANESALRLYDKDGVVLSSDQVLTLLSKNQNNLSMKKLQFFVAALSLAATATEDDVLNSVTALSKKAGDLETEIETLKADKVELSAKLTASELKVSEVETSKIATLIGDAITSGKLTADKKEQFETLAKTNFDLAKTVIDGLPARKSLSATIEGAKAGDVASKTFEGWGLKKLHKEAPLELARIKAAEPDRYQQLLKENA